MLIVIFSLVVIVILSIVHDRVKNRRLYELAEKFPGPFAVPIIGNSKDFITDSHGIFMKLLGFFEKHGRFFRLWNGGKFYLFCSNYKDAEVILGSTVHIKKSESYKFIHPWIGDNILTGSACSISALGELWRKHRKVITPAFHFKILLEFLEVFNRKALIFCERLAEKQGKENFDIYQDVKLLALDNIYETAMGVNMEVQKNSDIEYVLAVKDMCHVANLRFYKVWLMIEPIFKLSRYFKMQENALRILHGTTDSVIKKKLSEYSKRDQSENKTDGSEFHYCPVAVANNGNGFLFIHGIKISDSSKKKAFLDLLLHSPEASSWSKKEFREEVDTILFAGHDTVSSALAFAFYCLASNPKYQENVYQEQMEIFGDSDRLPTPEDIQNMKYLERVIKEVQRLYPSAPIVARELLEDLELPGGVLVPKGTQINVMIYSIHRDPKTWNNPDQFDPDNFLPDAIQSRSPYSYIPFSAGPRNCLGQKYAMLEMKSTISLVVRKYRLLPSSAVKDKIRLAAEIILVSKNGINIRIEPRSS